MPNDILLLYSFSSEFYKFKRCSTHSIDELILSKIIFIDLNNFKEISSTETFRDLLKYILLENVICIQYFRNLILYDINSLQPIKTIEFEKYYNYFSKYNKNSLIALSQEAYDNNIEIFRLENNNLVKSYIIRKGFIFNNIYRWSDYSIRDYTNNNLLILKDKRIIIFCENKLYILKINFD